MSTKKAKGDKRKAAASAPPKVRSDGPKRVRGEPRRLASDFMVADLERADAAQISRAKTASIAAAYARYDTELLWWWGSDSQGWPVKATNAGNRELVLAKLVDLKIEPPASVAALKKNYKDRAGQAFVGTGDHVLDAPTDDDAQESQSSEDDSDDEVPLPVQTAPAAAAKPLRAPDLDDCPHCLTGSVPRFCTGCGMRRDLPYAHEQNVDIRKSRLLAPVTTESQHTDTKSTLSRRDKELQRLADAGPPFPRFALTSTPYTSTAAHADLRRSYRAPAYAPASDALVYLIQSGKLTSIGLATPITIEELESGRANAEFTHLIGMTADSTVKATNTLKAPPLTDLRAFFDCLVSTIYPALVERPQALADWMALAKTMIAIDRESGFESARQYAEQQLHACVHERRSFGPYDRAVLDSVWASHGRRPASAAVAASSASVPSRPASARAPSGELCWQFNTGAGCQWGAACRHKHQCNLVGCPTPQSHTAQNCPSKGTLRPAPALHETRSARMAHGSGGKRVGRNRDRGPPPLEPGAAKSN